MGWGDDLWDSVSSDPIGAIGTGIALWQAFQGPPDTPAGYQAALDRGSAASAALLDPNHPLYKRLVAEEGSTIARDYALALRRLGTENQRQMARTGGMGILDPERRDESLAAAFAKSATDRKALARQQARAYLSGAITANGAIAGAYAPQIGADQYAYRSSLTGYSTAIAAGNALLNGDPRAGPTINVNADILNPPGLSFTSPALTPTTYTTPRSV